ncbi:acidic leucine-rich nuclear phosphoprotein 32-related protein [Cyclospora cayetanensis]|uniref:Acidic leucine-rich nuclear phosphoprotein 32-related protein n=1 Tax=Cyclospora cayetanensis TaxID=88456 RepID=A0A6P6RSE2_9EIME|nr:acidic leucine-rich nuclear phosphoprotein 32-related protein [Cyclospora cayetanensis]
MEAAIAERVEQFLAAVAAEDGGPPAGAPNGTSGVDVYQELTELILDGRSIRGITPEDAAALKKFHNLTKLTLNQTGLASLANLPCMSSVRTLEATDNHISSCLKLLVDAFPNLRKLQLGGNHIKTFEDLEPLVGSIAGSPKSSHRFPAFSSNLQARLSQLEQLGLDLNPVASLANYREKVFSIVPSLVVLDSRDRQGEEREAADSDSEEEEDDEGEEVDTTLKDFYEAEMPEQDAEDAEDFEPPCDAEDDEDIDEEDEG